MLEQPAVKTLETIANAFVLQGKYQTQSDALRAIALDHATRKAAFYQNRIRRFEKKYRLEPKTDKRSKRIARNLEAHWNVFNQFTARLQNRATIAQEDDWMDWEAALEMYEGWQKMKGALGA